jgi:streptogramin lyase
VPSGDLLVGIFDSDLGPVVLRVNPGNGSCTPIVDTSTCPPLQEIAGMILDANGDLLVADEGAAAVLRIDPGDGSCTVLVNASSCTPVPLQEPVGLVLDANGMLLVSDEGSAAILQINPGNGSCTALPNGMGLPFGTLGGIGVDPSGNPLVIDTLRSEVVRVDRTSGDRAIISK